MNNLEFSNDTVEWTFSSKKIKIQLDNVIMSSVDEINNYIIIQIGEKFITKEIHIYDFSGNKLLYCNKNSGVIDWIIDGKNRSMEITNILNIGLFLKKKAIIVMYLANEKEGIIFDLEGEFVAELEKFPNYEMEYFQEFPDYISVVMEGNKETEDKYGRSSKNFKINILTGELEEVGLTY